MELLASAGYLLLGGEQYWIPRALSALFWLAGGGFLYGIAKKMIDDNTALFSTVIYLFLPFAVTASRSFQPDPLMILLLLAGVYAMIRYDEHPSMQRLGIVTGISALTIFIKPVSLFVIFSTFLALTATRKGVRRSLMDRSLAIFFVVAFLPASLFYLYGILNAGSLKLQAQASFLPQLLITPFFWKGWLHNIGLVVGIPAFIGSLLGVLLVRPGRSRAFLLGMWAGYALFCLAFDYHIATHDYYHLQLIPIVALSLGSLGTPLMDRLLELNRGWHWRAGIAAILMLAFTFLTIKALPHPLDPSLKTDVAVEEKIGEQVNHDTNTVYLSSDYGLSLEYHGELSGLPWPLSSDLEWERLAGVDVLDAPERFQSWFAQNSPRYFIVLDPEEYEQQPDLEKFLTENYPILSQSDDYIIFDLQK